MGAFPAFGRECAVSLGANALNIGIRKARTEDAGAIIEVLKYADFLKDRYRGEEGISLVESLVETDPDMIWLVDLHGQVASVMIVKRKDEFGYLEISLLVTEREFLRHGFARRPTHKAKQLAADNKLDLAAYPKNEKSKNLLISERFKFDGMSADELPSYRFQRENP